MCDFKWLSWVTSLYNDRSNLFEDLQAISFGVKNLYSMTLSQLKQYKEAEEMWYYKILSYSSPKQVLQK